MRRFAFAATLLACFAVGCSTTTRVTYNPDASQDIRSVAVLPFDDKELSDQAADYAILGHTSENRSGVVVGKVFAQALEEAGAYEVLRGTKLTTKCLAEKIDLKKVGEMDPAELGRRLGVEGIVRGRVTAFRQSWFLGLSKATVGFEAACRDVRAGKEAWQASAEGYVVQGVEADLALNASREIAKGIAARKGSAAPK